MHYIEHKTKLPVSTHRLAVLTLLMMHGPTMQQQLLFIFNRAFIVAELPLWARNPFWQCIVL